MPEKHDKIWFKKRGNMTIEIRAESTPNPNSKKFITSILLAEEPKSIASSDEAHISPLANKLFGFPWMSSVYIGSNFITVTKQDWVDWEILTEPLCGLIKEHLENGEAVIVDTPTSAIFDENDSDEVKTIKTILDKEIRPQVALDGGDITFNKFEDGVVHLVMRGACSGCPSSVQTLKMGVEARLQEALPEIKEVVAVDA